MTTAGESESDPDEYNYDPDSHSGSDDDNDFNDGIAATTGDTPGDFDVEPMEGDEINEDVDDDEEIEEEIPDVPHQQLRAQPRRAANNPGLTHSAVNAKQ